MAKHVKSAKFKNCGVAFLELIFMVSTHFYLILLLQSHFILLVLSIFLEHCTKLYKSDNPYFFFVLLSLICW